MYQMNDRRAGEISGAVFMIGLGVLFFTGFWWPGIMFVVGACALVQGLVAGRGWYGLQGSLWLIGIGAWAMVGYSMALFFVVLGVSMLLSALIRPPFMAAKPRVDNSLE